MEDKNSVLFVVIMLPSPLSLKVLPLYEDKGVILSAGGQHLHSETGDNIRKL
jgi:hypothetical protein